MRILTWNINGVRATNKTSSMKSLLDSLEADIICLQETKVTRSLLPEDIANVNGYLSFFSFSRTKGGYSGVVTYCKKSCCPIAAEEGLSGVLTKDGTHPRIGHHVSNGFSREVLKLLDGEGRAVLTEHSMNNGLHICIFNIYCPRADVENAERYAYKMNFYHLLEARCKSLIAAGKHVIIVGDLNVSHKKIDHCDPDENFENNIARQWFNELLGQISREDDSLVMQNGEVNDDNFDVMDASSDISSEIENDKFLDIFRVFHASEKNAFTCWNSKTRARETNYGTRIDYILASRDFAAYFTDCCIRPDILGSDHCPVEGDLSLHVVPSKIVPGLCSIFMPELFGKQVDIKSFFSKDLPSSSVSALSVPHKRENDCSGRSTVLKMRKLRDKDGNSRSSIVKYFASNCKKENTILQTTRSEEPESHKNVPEDISNSTFFCQDRESRDNHNKAKACWKNILRGPDPVPLCSGHKEKSVVRTVKKEGPNLGKQFYTCNRPAGHPSNKEARCDFFQWKKLLSD